MAQQNRSSTLTDWGVTGLNAAADKARTQAASDGVSRGATLAVPPGQYRFDGGGLVQRREHDWRLDPGALLRGDYPAGGRADLLRIAITDSDSPESRGAAIAGGRFLVNAQPLWSAGGAAIAIDATRPARPVIGHRITGAQVTGGAGGAVRYTGTSPDATVAWSTISHASLGGTVTCSGTADGMAFSRNISFGPQTAYRLDTLEGSFCHSIDGCAAQTGGGVLDVVNASLWRLTNVQAEHDGSAPSRLPGAAQLVVRGAAYPSILGIVARCNFGAGVGRVGDTIVLQRAYGTVIDENYFFTSDVADIRIESVARHTVIGSRNMVRGPTRRRRGTGQYTDASRMLVITLPPDSAGRRAIGTRGVWHPAGDVLANFRNSWAVEGLEVMLTENGLVVFNGGLHGGDLSGAIADFPPWLRPSQDAWLHVTLTDLGTVVPLRLAAATGTLSIPGRLASGIVNFSNATFAAVLGVPYDAGP